MISLYGNNNSGNYGLYAYYGDKVEYYFNSVNVSAGSTSARAMYRSGNAGNTVGQTFKNNVFSCTTGGHAAYFNNTTSLVASDYNVYWTDTVANSNFIYKSGNNVTIGDFITATNLDSNSLQANPGFISEMDLHKSPASPNDMGTPIAMITTDIDGDTRKALTPDQGADEWDQPANDITLTSFVSPVSALCGDLAADVKVIVYNLGTNAQTSIPVTVMGSGPSGAINLTYNIPSMASGFVDTVTVGTISTLAAGTYNLKAYSTLSTDMEPNNDTITTMVEIEDAIAVPFIEDFSSNMYNWKTSQYMTIGTSTHGYTSDMMFSNLYGSRVHEHFELDGKVGTVPSDAYFVFDYRIVDYASGNPATILNADSMIVSMSGDCQSTWSEIYVIDTNTHIPSQNMQTIMLPLTAFAGNDVSFRFDLHYDQGDYWVNFDNIAIVTPPMVNLGPDTSFCGGSMITLDAGNDSSYMMSYMWTDLVSGDTLGYGQMLDVDSSMTIVAMIANQFGMMDYDTIMTTVYAPTAVSFTGLAASYCDNEMAATLVGTPTTGTFMGAGITGTSFDPMAAGQGNHMITYTIVDANMCTYMTMDSTMVYAAPAATMSADATICEGDSTMLSVSGQVAVPAEQSMIFSVYIEGTSNNKAIEVFNTTGATLNLDNYRIAQATNGNGWQYYHTFPAGATLAAYSSWVMITDQTDTNMYNPALADEVLSYPSLVHHNGDDARGIEVTTDGGTTWTLIDLIGDPNNDPGSAWDVAGVTNATANHTMVRKSNVMSGDTNWIAVAGTDSLSSQYMVYPVNSFNLLDSHVMDMTAANLTYLWSNGATTADVYVMPTSTTTYTVTVSNGNCTEMGSVEITVNPIPMVNLGADQMIKWTAGSVMLDAGNAGATYLWNTGATTQTETFDNTNLTNGMVNVVYVDVTENGCTGSDTVLIDVMDDVSINGALSNVSMNVYPNPNSGNFTMTIEGFNGEMNMEIVNLSGQVVYTETLNTQAGFVADFDMSALSTGVYYIRLSSNNGVKVHKLVIK
jgi:hypothetical protein